MIEIITAKSASEISLIRDLFQEYAISLGVDLSFQNFDNELAELPGRYASPKGLLLLAYFNQQAAGCCALRPFESRLHINAAEIKRLYVRPDFRKNNIGKKLVEAAVTYAKKVSYETILLDTWDSMTTAIRVYEQLGFQPMAPYYDTPIANTQFFKLKLA